VEASYHAHRPGHELADYGSPIDNVLSAAGCADAEAGEQGLHADADLFVVAVDEDPGCGFAAHPWAAHAGQVSPMIWSLGTPGRRDCGRSSLTFPAARREQGGDGAGGPGEEVIAAGAEEDQSATERARGAAAA
jgi:hypothetical protein